MTLIRRASHGVVAVQNFVSYPFRFRRVGRSWRDGWTALMLRLASTRLAARMLRPKECTLRLKGVASPVTLRRTNSDFFVVRDVFENDDYGTVRRMNLPADARIVDLGANIGITSLYFASLYPRCRILAVEPDAANAELAERNCRDLIAPGRMTMVRAFAGASDGVAGIDRSDQSWGFKKTTNAAADAGDAIPCLSMATLLDRHPMQRIDLLKCDIEGSEAELFADCASWVGRVANLVIEVHPPYSPALLYHHLRAAGWEFDVCDQQQRGPEFFLCTLSRRTKS
jgi:FkbM family methyltransferase